MAFVLDSCESSCSQRILFVSTIAKLGQNGSAAVGGWFQGLRCPEFFLPLLPFPWLSSEDGFVACDEV